MKLTCLLDPSNCRIARMYVVKSDFDQRMLAREDFLKFGMRLRSTAGFSRRVIAVAQKWKLAGNCHVYSP